MVIVHNFFQEIVDVELRAAIDNGFNLGEQFVEVESLCIGDVVECYLSVDALDDFHLQHGLLSHCAHAHILWPHNLVLLAMLTDEVAERLSVALSLADADTLNVLQFFERHGEHCCHLLQGDILEDDVGGEVVLLGHLLAQVLEHGDERQVESRAHSFHVDIVVVVVELGILNNHEGMWILQEALAGCGDLQQTVVLDFLAQIACD